jgi:hypothetical protein
MWQLYPSSNSKPKESIISFFNDLERTLYIYIYILKQYIYDIPMKEQFEKDGSQVHLS